MLCLGVKLAKKFSLIVFDGQTHFIIDQDCNFLSGVLDFLFGFCLIDFERTTLYTIVICIGSKYLLFCHIRLKYFY